MSYAKVLLGLVISFITGAGCQLLRIPVPSPPVLSGALLVFAMSVGYWLVDRVMRRRAAQHKHLCGGHAVSMGKEG
ncbi:DUF1427 family protein [Duganella qianjiadongensis]|uniref:XapX domain-containing protein n=1 Tax=Duganella qianjiadongensis TaxID=2692176 RepID=A0ABW9VMA7_9BURK|nr:DUF1427 family protein [Duganella qianjiadongensis]MYM38792.1 XapX domain-containing protein [Duganella qianjiadongensis]